MKPAIPTDALVTAEDVENVKACINRGEFQRLVYELVALEPELAIMISEKYDLVTTILDNASLSVKNRAVLSRQLSLLVWSPLVLLARVHRRSWNDFLPSEEVVDGADDEGGAA